MFRTLSRLLKVAIGCALTLALAGCGGGVEIEPWLKYDIATPARLVAPVAFEKAGLGDGHSCMLTAAGKAWCWGLNDGGQLGSPLMSPCGDDDAFECSAVPLQVPGSAVYTVIDGSRFRTCGLEITGRVQCWGWNDLDPLPAPTPIGSGSDLFVQIDVASFASQACGVKADGSAWCWDRTTPQPVAPGLVVTRIALGELHTCVLDAGGRAWCWGSNWYGQLGRGPGGDTATPVAVAGGMVFQWIGAGSSFNCALDPSGRAWCWGDGNAIGAGDDVIYSDVPVPVAGALRFTRLTVGASHTCGLTGDGTAWCWGYSREGSLGDGTTLDRKVPVAVAGGLKFRELSAGSATCGITLAGEAWCWGWNKYGAVGQPAVGYY